MYRAKRIAGLLIFAGLLLLVAACAPTPSMQRMSSQPAYRPLDPSSFYSNGQSARPLPPDTVARGQLQDDTQLYTGKNSPMQGTPAGAPSGTPSGAPAGAPGTTPGQGQSQGQTTPQQTPGASSVSPGGTGQPPGAQPVATPGAAITQTTAADVDAFPFPITRDVLARGQDRFNIYCSPCHGRTGEGNGMIVQRGFAKPPSFHQDRLRSAPVGHFFDVMTNGFGSMPSYAPQIPVRDRWAIAAYIRALQFSEHATINDVPADQRQQLEAQP